MTEYRIDYTITSSEDGFETQQEVGFGASGTEDSIEQCAHMIMADIQHDAWETAGPQR